MSTRRGGREQRQRRRAAWITFPSSVGFAVKELLAPWVNRLLERLVARLDDRIDVDGILVIIDSEHATDRDRIHAGLAEALEKLTAWSPRMRRRLDSKVHRVLIEPANVATYHHPGMITIPLQCFQRTDSDYVASLIVHESIHERFEARGIRYWPRLRPRLERRCLREQIAFLASRGRTDLLIQQEAYLRRRWSDD